METLGQKVFGKFNPTGNETVEKIKSLCAELFDIIEAQPTNGRISAATKTKAQMDLLASQMEAVKLLFYPKDI